MLNLYLPVLAERASPGQAAISASVRIAKLFSSLVCAQQRVGGSEVAGGGINAMRLRAACC